MLLFGSVLPSTAPHTESVWPLPTELSLLMCFMSPLQFHIPEQLSCSKKLEIQRGLFLLFYPFAHQLRLTITGLEKRPWVQPLVCRSMSSLWALKPAGSFCLCVPSVSLSPALAAVGADLAAQVPLAPCGRALPAGVQERGMDWKPLSLPGCRRGSGWGAPVPDAGRRRDEDLLSLPGCRRGWSEDPLSLTRCRRGVMRSCSPCWGAGWGGRGLRSCRFGTVAVALEGRRESLGSAHSALLESCGVTNRKGMSWCPAEMIS